MALIFVDYPNQVRLKILGTVKIIDQENNPDQLTALVPKDYKAKVERGFLITVEGYDWNCPQHITPRWSADQVKNAIAPLQEKISQLEAQIEALKKKK